MGKISHIAIVQFVNLVLLLSCLASVAIVQSPSELVLKSIGMVLTDDGFKVPSTRATEALEAASKMLEWSKLDANENQFSKFSKWLVVALKACFTNSRSKTWRIRVENMWQKFHELRVSDEFTGEWEKLFQESLGKPALPTLYQYR